MRATHRGTMVSSIQCIRITGGYPYGSVMGTGKGWAQHQPGGETAKLQAAECSPSSSEVRNTSNPNMPLQASGRASGDIKAPLLKRQEIICIILQ